MLSRIFSFGLRGVEGYPVVVELDLANGLPGFTTVGLPDAAVREARERVCAAVRNSGYKFPPRRVTVNLAPVSSHRRARPKSVNTACWCVSSAKRMLAGLISR